MSKKMFGFICCSFFFTICLQAEQLEEVFNTDIVDSRDVSEDILLDFFEGKLSLKGDSEALITKGILSLLIRIFNNQSPLDVSNADVFLPDKTGLNKSLSPSRAHGMNSMIQQIKINTRKFLGD